MAQGIEGERGGRERTRLPGREQCVEDGPEFREEVSQSRVSQGSWHQPHPSATPISTPSCPDQRAPLRQGALVQGHASLWQRNDERLGGQPLRLCTGTGWPAGGPVLCPLPSPALRGWLASLQMVQRRGEVTEKQACCVGMEGS